MSQNRPRLYNRLVTQQQQQQQQRRDRGARETQRTDHVQWERGAASWRGAQQIARSRQQTDGATATARDAGTSGESTPAPGSTTKAPVAVSEDNVPTLSGMQPMPIRPAPAHHLSTSNSNPSKTPRTPTSAAAAPAVDAYAPVQERSGTDRSCAELSHPTSQTWFKQQQQQWHESRRPQRSGSANSKPPIGHGGGDSRARRQHNRPGTAGNGGVTHGAEVSGIRADEDEEAELSVEEDEGDDDDDDAAEQEAVRQWNTRTKSQGPKRKASSAQVQARAQARARPHSAALRRPPRRSVRPASAAPVTRRHASGEDARSKAGARAACGHDVAPGSSVARSGGTSVRKKPSSAGARWLNTAAMPAPAPSTAPSGHRGGSARASSSSETGDNGDRDGTGDTGVTMDLVWTNRGRGDGLSLKDRRRVDEAARSSARADTVIGSGETTHEDHTKGDAEQRVRPSVRIGGREIAPYGSNAVQATMQQRFVRRTAGTSARAFSARARRPASGAPPEGRGSGKPRALRPKSAPSHARASRHLRPASGRSAAANASGRRRLIRPSAAAQGRRSRWQRQQERVQARQKARVALDDAIAELEDGSGHTNRPRSGGQRSGQKSCGVKDSNAWQQRAETLLFNPGAPMPPKPGGSARAVAPVPAAVVAAAADMLDAHGTGDAGPADVVFPQREHQVQAEQQTHGELQVAHKWLPHVSSFLSQTNAVIHQVVAVAERAGETAQQRGCRIEVDLARPRFDTFMQHMPEEATVGGGIAFFATPAQQESQQPSIVRALRRMVDETAADHDLQAAEALRLQHAAAEQKAATVEAATFAVQMRGQPARGSAAPQQAPNNGHEPQDDEQASMVRELRELRQRVASLERRNSQEVRDDRERGAAQSVVPQEDVGELHSLERGWSEQVPWKSGKGASGGEPVSLSQTVLRPGGELEQRLNWVAGDDDSDTSGNNSRRSSCSSNAALNVRESNTTRRIVDGSLGPAGYWGSTTQTKVQKETEREELRQQRKRKDQRLVQALTERVADDIVARELAPSEGSEASEAREEAVHFGPTTLTEQQEFRSLLSAAAKGDLDRVRLLIDVNQHVNINWQGDPGTDLARTALHLAARGGQVDTVWFLLNRGADATSCDATGLTPLESAKQAMDTAYRAAENGSAMMAHTAARVQACVDVLDTTSVFEAARTGDVRRVRYLLTCEALDPRVSNKNGMTALHMAVANQQQDVVDLLLGITAGSGSDPALRKKPAVSPAMVLELCALRNNRGHLPVDLAKAELDEAMKRGGGAAREMQEALAQKGTAGGEDGEGSARGRSVAAKAAARATRSRQDAAELMVARFHDIAKRAEDRAVQRGHNAIQSEQAAKRTLRKAALAKEVARGTAASAAVIKQHAKAVHRAAAATERRRRVAGDNVEPHAAQVPRRGGSASRQRAPSSLQWDEARSYVVGAAKSRGRRHARFEAVTMRADTSKESSKGPVERTHAARRRARTDMKNGKLAVSDARFQTWFRAQYPTAT